MCLGAGSTQYCRYTKSPLVINPLKDILETPRVNENLTLEGFEPTTSGLDLPMLYRLSYEASTGVWVLRGSHTKYLYHLNIYRDSLPKLPPHAPVLAS